MAGEGLGQRVLKSEAVLAGTSAPSLPAHPPFLVLAATPCVKGTQQICEETPGGSGHGHTPGVP